MSYSIIVFMIQLLFLILGPLLFPLIYKKWYMLAVVLIGYGLYLSWGIYLYINDYVISEAGYGVFLGPYQLLLLIISFMIQRKIEIKKIYSQR